MQSPSVLIRQHAYVVESIERAARSWAGKFGIGPFFCVRHLEFENVLYRGQPTQLDISVALGFSGHLCIEFIEQHNDGPSAYRDVVPKGQSGFHHVLVYPDHYEAEIRRYEAHGFQEAGSAVLKSTGLRFAYMDTRPELGCMVELASKDTPALWAPMIEAARNWDGQSNPIVERSQLGSEIAPP
jgi:Glyoxalase/Bleomycin resistance protein/Dioxygenase superfamily